MAEGDLDERLRAAAFAYLDRLRARDGDRISYRDLAAFEFEGRVPREPSPPAISSASRRQAAWPREQDLGAVA